MNYQRCGLHGSCVRANEEGAVAGSDGHCISLMIFNPVANTHRSTGGTSGNRYLNTFICFETIDAACGNKLRRIRAGQDLEQYWDGGGFKGEIINSEGEARGILFFT